LVQLPQFRGFAQQLPLAQQFGWLPNNSRRVYFFVLLDGDIWGFVGIGMATIFPCADLLTTDLTWFVPRATFAMCVVLRFWASCKFGEFDPS
jgi:hypothetical protein